MSIMALLPVEPSKLSSKDEIPSIWGRPNNSPGIIWMDLDKTAMKGFSSELSSTTLS